MDQEEGVRMSTPTTFRTLKRKKDLRDIIIDRSPPQAYYAGASTRRS